MLTPNPYEAVLKIPLLLVPKRYAMQRPTMRLSATVLDAPDARTLAAFYEQLLGWQRVEQSLLKDGGIEFEQRNPLLVS